MNTVRKIGFAGTYYTLWDIDTCIEYGYGGLPYNKVYFRYLQNLSVDEGKAIEKARKMGATDLVVDPELFGRNRSWEKQDRLFCEIPKDKSFYFEFGKYGNEIIWEVNDIEYLYWYYGQTNNIHALRVLKNNGYQVRDAGALWTPEQVERERIALNKKDSLEEDATVFVTFISNIRVSEVDEEGDEVFAVNTEEYGWIKITKGVPLKRMEYKGFVYYLPSVNGVGKKIKDKNLPINTDENKAIEEFMFPKK